MTCDPYRELISAQIDGELAAADEPNLEQHLETCASCRSYQQDGWALRRSFQIQSVPAGSNRAPAAETASALRPNVIGSLRGLSFLRWTLFIVGATLVVINAQAILFVDGTQASHLGRHDGVFGTALGIGMVAVAIKPHRAIGLVPLTSAIAVLMAVVAAADLTSGKASMLSEAIHVVEFAGLVCLWVISGGFERLQRRIGQLSPGRLAAPSRY